MAGVLTCVRAQGRRCALVDGWCTTAERRLRGNSSGRSSARLELMASHWQRREWDLEIDSESMVCQICT